MADKQKDFQDHDPVFTDQNRADKVVHEALQNDKIEISAADIQGLDTSNSILHDQNRADSVVFDAMQNESLHNNTSGAKINPVASGSTKNATVGPSKKPFDQDPEPFEEQQDPRRPIGQHQDKGRPPLMKK